MKLFLDSKKQAPVGFTQVTSVDDAIFVMRNQNVTHVAFGEVDGRASALDLAKFMKFHAVNGDMMPYDWSLVDNKGTVALLQTLETADWYWGKR